MSMKCKGTISHKDGSEHPCPNQGQGELGLCRGCRARRSKWRPMSVADLSESTFVEGLRFSGVSYDRPRR